MWSRNHYFCQLMLLKARFELTPKLCLHINGASFQATRPEELLKAYWSTITIPYGSFLSYNRIIGLISIPDCFGMTKIGQTR